MNKYIVVNSDEAIAKGYPFADLQCPGDEWCYICYETDGEKPIRIVGSDAGEPEDKILIRNFSWVADELNKLDKDISILTMTIVEMAKHR
jgi:hypothetical protein